MLKEKWSFPPRDIAADIALAHSAGISRLTAAVLRARGFTAPDDVQAFFDTGRAPLSDPFALPDMDKAVRRLRLALRDAESIGIIGDYDADGVTATYILGDYLESRGVKCVYHIPDRVIDGYGVSESAVRQMAQQGVSLIITVDTGITACAPVVCGAELGVDFIVTDHHKCPEILPDAVAVVDPWRDDSPELYRGLSGVGVAFKLISALDGDGEAVLARYADVICLGTVADVMPLVGENRRIVLSGLERLERHPNTGLKALLELLSGTRHHVERNVQTVAFLLSPMINAPGRMATADVSLRLLQANPDEAQSIAARVDALNTERQAECLRIEKAAAAMLEETDFSPERDGGIFLCDPEWHTGILGIVCARLVERYRCPVVLATRIGDSLKASARSVRGIHLHEMFSAISEHIQQFGGHELAAGLTLEPEKADDFARAMREYILAHRTDPSCSDPRCIDCEVSLQELTVSDVRDLSRLAPFGEGNPEPVFALQGAVISDVTPLKDGLHTRLSVSSGGITMTALCFGRAPWHLGIKNGDRADLLFVPQVNTFRGTCSVNLILRDLWRYPDADEQKYIAFCEKSPLSADHVRSLIPDRSEFAAVWRILNTRRYEELASLPIPRGRLAVIFDVFAEAGLTVCDGELYAAKQNVRKADLNATPTMTALFGALSDESRFDI